MNSKDKKFIWRGFDGDKVRHQFVDRDEWLAFRKNLVGGSDASAILGKNPYKTNVELYLEKIGLYEPEDISSKPYVRYGIEAEEHLIELFKLDYPDYAVETLPFNCWTNDRYPWAHASLDGWLTDKDGRKGVLEIKTTEILRSQQKENWKDRIPDNYYIQVLWYLMVTEFDFAILRALLRWKFDDLVYSQIKDYRIERTEVEEDIAMLEEAGKKFADSIKKRRKPDLKLPEI